MSNTNVNTHARHKKQRTVADVSLSYAAKSKLSKWAVSIARAVLLFGLCFMIIQPLLTRFFCSFMAEEDLYDTTVTLIPRNPTLENYAIVSGMTRLWQAMFNSLWVSTLVAVFEVGSATLVAYGFARYDFPLKKFWFFCVILCIVIPPVTLESSMYITYSAWDIFGIFRAMTGKAVNLRSSPWGYFLLCACCQGFKNGLYVYILRQYFKGVPTSLEEAAYVDGCSNLHTFAKIMLPDALPMIASCFLFAFVWQWTDRFYTNLFMKGTVMFSINVENIGSYLANYLPIFYHDSAVRYDVTVPRVQQMISIGVLLCATPLIIIYCFAQKTFVQSLVMTGSKE